MTKGNEAVRVILQRTDDVSSVTWRKIAQFVITEDATQQDIKNALEDVEDRINWTFGRV